MTVGCANDRFWRQACEILGCQHLADDQRFLDKPARVQNVAVLVEELAPYFAQQKTAHWCEQFERAGVPAGPVMNHVEALSDPQALARNMVADVEHTRAGATKTLGVTVKLSETPGAVRRAAPLLNEHENDILREWLPGSA